MVLVLALLACAATEPPSAPSTEPAPPVEAAPAPAPEPAPVEPVIGIPAEFTECPAEWKKGGCTLERREACGLRADGSAVTAPNACVACQRGAIATRDGACP